jgi:hypothetical protein
VVVDVYDANALRDAICDFEPEVVMHQLTDLPDDAAKLAASRESNARMRDEGTANLVHAARAAGAGRFLAQSISWDLDPEYAGRLEEHERLTLGFHGAGVVLRYGQFYGPGTYRGGRRRCAPGCEVVRSNRRGACTLPKIPAGAVVLWSGLPIAVVLRSGYRTQGRPPWLGRTLGRPRPDPGARPTLGVFP